MESEPSVYQNIVLRVLFDKCELFFLAPNHAFMITVLISEPKEDLILRLSSLPGSVQENPQNNLTIHPLGSPCRLFASSPSDAVVVGEGLIHGLQYLSQALPLGADHGIKPLKR